MTWVVFFARLFVCLDFLSHGVSKKKENCVLVWLRFEGLVGVFF